MNDAHAALAAGPLRGQVARVMNVPPIDLAPERILEAARLPPEERPPAVRRIMASFGRNFREARIAAGMSQQEVERLTGIPQHYISTLERGHQNPTLETMTRLAEAAGKPLSDLLRP